MPNQHEQAWEDWGALNPLYAILTDPRYRHGESDVDEFMATGEGLANGVMGECERLGLAISRGRALDFGCGVGRVTLPLSRRFSEVIGLDVSTSMIDSARRRHADQPNCTFEVHKESDLRRFPDLHFDLVFCVLVLQHLPSQGAIVRFLEEFARVLRPGGALVVQLPSSVVVAPPLPGWRTRAGVRMRVAPLLRGLGVSPAYLYRRLDWVPAMTMMAVPDEMTRETLARGGLQVVFTTPPDVDLGGTVSQMYFATRPH
jgi:SAM-dependent methyltransferase